MTTTLRFKILPIITILFSEGGQSQWQQWWPPGPAPSITHLVHDGVIFYRATYDGGVTFSTSSSEDGYIWTAIPGLQAGFIPRVAYHDSAYCVLSDGTGGTYIIGGGGWTLRPNHPLSTTIVRSGSTIVAIFPGICYRSTNYGISWDLLPTSIPDISYTSLVTASAWIIGNDFGISRSVDQGANWTHINDPPTAGVRIQSLVLHGTEIYASARFRSTDDGLTWTSVGVGLDTAGSVFSLASGGGVVLAGTATGVYASADPAGSGWTPKNDGLPYPRSINSIIVVGDYSYAAVAGNGLWRRAIGELTSVNTDPTTMPAPYSLEQNYPNPFNPTTTIAYSIDTRQSIILTIYDLLGREVTTLVSETQNPGSYEVSWDATGQGSGVYFYRLTTGRFLETRKLVLVR
jgi:hypothetical protein